MILGRPTIIYVDDYLPFNGSSQNLYFAGQTYDNALWVSFVEKIWAKASGSYENAQGGWSAEAVRFLTGAPTLTFTKGSQNW